MLQRLPVLIQLFDPAFILYPKDSLNRTSPFLLYPFIITQRCHILNMFYWEAPEFPYIYINMEQGILTSSSIGLKYLKSILSGISLKVLHVKITQKKNFKEICNHGRKKLNYQVYQCPQSFIPTWSNMKLLMDNNLYIVEIHSSHN